MSVLREYKDFDVKRELPVGLYDILVVVMGYVDEAHKHDIDPTSIEQELQDIEDNLEVLAMAIEKGRYEKWRY